MLADNQADVLVHRMLDACITSRKLSHPFAGGES
jgi:hypothetical protein